MSLNDSKNIINQISKMTDDKLKNIDLSAFLVTKAFESDNIYQAKRENLHTTVQKWLKKSIRDELKNIKSEDGDNVEKFYIHQYSCELTKTDYIAIFDLNEDLELKKKKGKLLEALNRDTNEIIDDDVKFQVIKVGINNENVYFVYYRGIKKLSTPKKNTKRKPVIRHGNELVFQENDVVEFGGSIELFIHEDNIYILSPKTLEYTFDYKDHISKKRDENLKAITSMGFFDENSNTDEFIEKSDRYMLSRKLAGIKKETLKVLENNFEERCEELKEIKENIPKTESEKKRYQERYKALWPLYDHIDVISKKVRFNLDKPIEPLLHLFSDKIVESFLTKNFRDD